MAQKGTPYFIPFGASGMVAHPNRWKAQAGEVTLAENVVFEQDMLNKDPRLAYYHTGHTTTLEWLPVSGTWAGIVQTNTLILLAHFPGTFPEVAPVTTLHTGSTNPGVTWVLNGTHAAGFHILALSREAGAGLASGVVDSLGRTYTLLGSSTGGGLQVQLWGATPITASGAFTVTVTLTDGTADVNAVGVAYQDISSLSHYGLTGATAGDSFVAPASATAEYLTEHRYPLRVVGIVAGTDTGGTLSLLGGWNSPTNANDATGAHHTYEITRWFPGHVGIIGQYEWRPEITLALAGTVSVTAGSRTLTGVGTSFTTSLRPGDELLFAGQTFRIAEVVSNTVITLTEPSEQTISGVGSVQGLIGPRLVSAAQRISAAAGADPTITLDLLTEDPTALMSGLRGNLRAQVDAIGTTAERRIKFVLGGREDASRSRRLFIFTGTFPVQVATGVTALANIANPAADWGSATDPYKQPISGIIHQDRLMAFGNLNDSHRLYISSPTDHEDFTAAGGAIQLRIASQIGERLYSAATYQGVLFLWKYPEGIFYVDDTSVDIFQWSYRIKSAKLGCAPSPHAALAIDDDVIFCDPQGHFHLLSAVNTLGGTRDSDLTRMLGLQRWTTEHVHTASLEQMVSVYDGRTKTAWFGLRSVEAAANNCPNNDLIVRFEFAWHDTQRPLPRVSTSRNLFADSLCLKRRDYLGTEVPVIAAIGQAYMLVPDEYGSTQERDFVAAEDVEVGVPTEVALPELDLADSAAENRLRKKAWKALEAVFNDTGSSAEGISVTITVDQTVRQTVTFTGTGQVRRTMQSLNCGDGHTIQLTVTSDGSEPVDVGLLGFILYYDLTATDESRSS